MVIDAVRLEEKSRRAERLVSSWRRLGAVDVSSRCDVVEEDSGCRREFWPRPRIARKSLAGFYAPIAPALAEAERIFAAELGSRFPFVQKLVDHCADFRGKRLRPALVLLTGQACGGSGPRTRCSRRSSR